MDSIFKIAYLANLFKTKDVEGYENLQKRISDKKEYFEKVLPCLKNVESELIQSVLSSDYNIYIGIGSGCSDGSFEVNKTLKAKGVPEEFIRGPIRLSFSDKNTEEEVVEVIDKIVEVYHKVKQSAPKD